MSNLKHFDTNLSFKERAHALVEAMTLEEKNFTDVTLCSSYRAIRSSSI